MESFIAAQKYDTFHYIIFGPFSAFHQQNNYVF
jgi:hypothetical protein